MSSEYYALLTNLAQQLSRGDLKKLVFSCGNILPPSSAEKITSGIDLFRELKQRGHLGPANYDYLGKQLVVVGRHDLASMLPDKVEILYGPSKIRDSMYFGCVVSPTPPVDNPEHFSKLMFCYPNTDSRMFLMYISQQLHIEESMKLAFLMYPSQSHTTAIGLVHHLEREGGMCSIDVVNKFSSCLEAIGRHDLAELVNALIAPHKLLSSLSTSQQQLNLKMSLLLHSKQQSYDFYMRALIEVESDSEIRAKLLRPAIEKFNYFDPLKFYTLAKNIQTDLQNNSDPNLLVKTSLFEALKVNQACMRQFDLLESHENLSVEKLCDLTKQVQESYKSFSSLMEILNWNSTFRGELRETVELHRSPIGTPAELACKYILEISQEICQCDTLGQEMQKVDQHLLALKSIYYSCGYHIITLQWLATLLCIFTPSEGSDSMQLNFNLCKHTDTLRCIIEQKKDEIIESYYSIAEIVGPDIMQKLIPLQDSQSTEAPSNQKPLNLAALHFNIFLIKLLAVATLGQESPNVGDLSFMQADNNLCNQAFCCISHRTRVAAAAMKREVESLRDKALSEDRLCSRVIAKLTEP